MILLLLRQEYHFLVNIIGEGIAFTMNEGRTNIIRMIVSRNIGLPLSLTIHMFWVGILKTCNFKDYWKKQQSITVY